MFGCSLGISLGLSHQNDNALVSMRMMFFDSPKFSNFITLKKAVSHKGSFFFSLLQNARDCCNYSGFLLQAIPFCAANGFGDKTPPPKTQAVSDRLHDPLAEQLPEVPPTGLVMGKPFIFTDLEGTS